MTVGLRLLQMVCAAKQLGIYSDLLVSYVRTVLHPMWSYARQIIDEIIVRKTACKITEIRNNTSRGCQKSTRQANSDSPPHELPRFSAGILIPLTGKSITFIRNPYDFAS
ncbi:hypothetical protein T265_09424 [Opisthorchis viverrini]|uniref:Uncharacterized protein n=1 Tax=Opisthorchis viverrini TaxID=6198 RepID=A0A074Z5Z7_OPIVI|nr:hypothetical protein T265_09424 [Opisthorchis viverrini]KER22503.1 hypothetical protein T265_09424 [Opisthorchis viverrini]